MSKVERKKNESFEGFMRRVKRQWSHSGKLLQARKVQFFTTEKSRNEKRKHAVDRSKINAQQDYLRKTGKLPEEDKRYRRR